MKFASVITLLFCLWFLPRNKGNPLAFSNYVKNRNPERVVRGYHGRTSIYTFLVTEGSLFGPLGRIESPIISCTTTLASPEFWFPPNIIVDCATGIVRLDTGFLPANIFSGPGKLTTTCRYSDFKYVTVNIFVFRKSFGDPFLRSYTPKLDNMVKENKNFDTQNGIGTSLHRMMRMVSKENNPETFNEMMASAKVDIVLEEALNAIVNNYFTKNSEQQIVFRWSLNSLFSTQALKELANAAHCNTKPTPVCSSNDEYRTIDGTCNNLNNPLFGSAPTAFSRLIPAKYFDFGGFKDPIGFPGQHNVPNIPATFKVVKEFITQQKKPQIPVRKLSHLVMQFGQFLDHDLDLSPETENSDKCMNTSGDGSKDDFCSPCYTILPFEGFKSIHFARSATECVIKRDNQITAKQQINVNTAFVDGSQIYGSSEELAKKLKDSQNKGLLKTRGGVDGDFLPIDSSRLMFPNNLCQPDCFLAGDGRRSNEQMVLACMQTLFLREHNRIARKLANLNKHWDGEKIYQETRKIVGAILQKITYEDYLPTLLGRNHLPKYKKYNRYVNPGILNSFATAAFRFGHSLIRPTFDRLDKGFNPTGSPLPLRQLFFNNTFINKFGIEQMLLGLLGNESQTVDRQLADGILNHLFERPHSPGLNLAALNIQRSRDHGLPGYNAFRQWCGLKNAKTFSDTAKEIVDSKNRQLLSQLYNDDPNLADLWVAGLAEAPVDGGIVGATFGCIIREQMKRVRDGDRFFYENPGVFSGKQLAEVKKTSFSRILCDNLKNIVSVQRDSFQAGTEYNRISCDGIPGIDLTQWRSDSGTCSACVKGIFQDEYGWDKYCSRKCKCDGSCNFGNCDDDYICGPRNCDSWTLYDECGRTVSNVVDLGKRFKVVDTII